MSAQERFVAAACEHLSVGRKSPSVSQSLDLAAQLAALDSGLKPSILYDINGASSEQVQRFLSTLQESQLVSESCCTLDLNGNTLIVNPVTARVNVELLEDNAAVIDVCHRLEKPAIADTLGEQLRSIRNDLVLLLRELEHLKEAEKPLRVGEKSDSWNLCTVFGILLGFPVIYWFDQSKSFENCLSMVPLTVTTASVMWQADKHSRTCLYSFSVPSALLKETKQKLENWMLQLQERFQQQNVLKDLRIHQSTVSLPSVCL